MFPSGSDSVPVFEARVAGLCGVINVATASLVDVIGEVIVAGDWAAGGYRSVEHWVSVHGGLSSGRAKG